MAGINDKCLFKPSDVIINGFHRHSTVLTFQKLCNRIGRKSLSHIFNEVLYNAVKKILSINPMTLHNVSGNNRMVDTIYNLIGILFIISSKSNNRKSTKTNILFQ